jgi:hypothetical protein
MVETSVTVPFNGGNLVDNYFEMSFCYLEAGKMMQVWRQDAPDWLFARVFNYDFSSSSEGPIRMYEGDYTTLRSSMVERLNSTQALHFYEDVSTGWYARILTIDGSDNITESGSTALSNITGYLGDTLDDAPSYFHHPKSNNTVWVMKQNGSNFDLYEYTISGSTINETSLLSGQNLNNNDPQNIGTGYGLREIPGTTDTVIWLGRDVFIVNDSGVVQSHIWSAHHSIDRGLTVYSESATSFYLFDDNGNGSRVQTWDGTDQGGTGSLVQYDADGGNRLPIWSEQVDANTWILWMHQNNDLFVKVIRRLDATTWETNTFTTDNGGAAHAVLGNQAASNVGTTQPPFKPVQQVDANNFVTCWTNHNDNNPFVIDFMNQT